MKPLPTGPAFVEMSTDGTVHVPKRAPCPLHQTQCSYLQPHPLCFWPSCWNQSPRGSRWWLFTAALNVVRNATLASEFVGVACHTLLLSGRRGCRSFVRAIAWAGASDPVGAVSTAHASWRRQLMSGKAFASEGYFSTATSNDVGLGCTRWRSSRCVRFDIAAVAR